MSGYRRISTFIFLTFIVRDFFVQRTLGVQENTFMFNQVSTLLLPFESTKLHLSSSIENAYTLFLDNKSSQIVYPENCTDGLNNFTQAVLTFILCSSANARPIQLCRNCNEYLSAMQATYKAMKEEPNVCQTWFFGSDKISIIDVIHNQAWTLWDINFCQNCYDYYNETKAFFDTAERLSECMVSSNTTIEVNSTCQLCHDLYIQLGDTYNKFVFKQEETDVGICMDIVDRMNMTQKLWSRQYKCKVEFDTRIGYGNVTTALVIGLVPLCFYLIAKRVAITEDVKLVRPKRKSMANIPAK
ncbi:osteopetrosis-associated transmembrane protein 1-like isoform X2 [Stegodyphus dumicola]|uniref:osteopetrosis-associated transmembrane protein 1-like isoform X2 n=1 Tax=Stegodyphus dumicola TaxID=202533 RepID=UPI0015B2718B|nr:osteopetrosis-associated transmembrane protein 1-like isoform X2 [Stegodyphus dumicola]